MKTQNLMSIVFTLVIALLLTSCEANRHISIKVIDAVTQSPIDSVYVKINAGKNGDYNKSRSKGYTNINGEFDTEIMIGCSFGCYDIYMEYSKEGYETKKDLNIIKGEILLSPKKY